MVDYMARTIEVVYEKGVLRPTEPLEAKEGSRLTVTLEEVRLGGTGEDLLMACNEFPQISHRDVSVEEVRQGLSSISGRMSDEVAHEREESR